VRSGVTFDVALWPSAGFSSDTFGDGKPLPKGLESNALRHQAWERLHLSE
jgi:hypothetical protein